MDLHYICGPQNGGDRCDVMDEVKAQLVIERQVPGIGRRSPEQCVAVRLSVHHQLSREVAASAGTVLNDKRLTKSLRQQLPSQPRGYVVRTAGRIADQQTHRPRRISLCSHDARQVR
jgi:hypothetical protein